MKFELIADKLASKYENETLLTEAVIQVAAMILGPLLGARYVLDNGIPNWITELAEGSVIYRIVSVIDPTGLMSWPYFQIALKNWKDNPDDNMNNIMLVLSVLSMIPGVGFGARIIVKILTYPVRLPFKVVSGLTRLFRSAGKALNSSSRAIDDAIPTMLAKMSGKTHNGVDSSVAMRQALEKSMGVKVTDEAIEAAAKRNNITLAKGLIKTGIALKTGAAVVKPFSRFSRTATAAKTPMKPGSGGIFNIKNTRTPVRYGPKQSYGQIGGVVRPL